MSRSRPMVGGPRECRDEGKVIPCSKGGYSWMSSPAGGCYGARLDNAPTNDPGWAGHNPSEGSIVYCPLDGVSGVTLFVPNAAAPQIVDAAAVAQRMLARAPFEVADVQMAPPYGSHIWVLVVARVIQGAGGGIFPLCLVSTWE